MHGMAVRWCSPLRAIMSMKGLTSRLSAERREKKRKATLRHSSRASSVSPYHSAAAAAKTGRVSYHLGATRPIWPSAAAKQVMSDEEPT